MLLKIKLPCFCCRGVGTGPREMMSLHAPARALTMQRLSLTAEVAMGRRAWFDEQVSWHVRADLSRTWLLLDSQRSTAPLFNKTRPGAQLIWRWVCTMHCYWMSTSGKLVIEQMFANI